MDEGMFRTVHCSLHTRVRFIEQHSLHGIEKFDKGKIVALIHESERWDKQG
ncbi:hypothetical protein D3C75_901800 [compost metagenome]